jgi:hypothetical protein
VILLTCYVHALATSEQHLNCTFFYRSGSQTTRLAVPYRACNVPSQRSEFKHPDVAIGLTHVSYYEKGLTKEDLVNALKALLPSRDCSLSVQQAIYRCDGSSAESVLTCMLHGGTLLGDDSHGMLLQKSGAGL